MATGDVRLNAAREILKLLGQINTSPSQSFQLPAAAPAPEIPAPTTPNFMQYLQNSNPQWQQENFSTMGQPAPVTTGAPEGEQSFMDKITGGKGIIGGLFDVLSRGAYASGSALQEAAKQGLRMAGPDDVNPEETNPFKRFMNADKGKILGAAVEGFEGQNKVLPSQVAQEQGAITKGGVGGFLQGLATDVMLDPTTYVGAGVIRGAVSAPGKAKAAILGSKGDELVSKAVDDIAAVKATPGLSDAAVHQASKDYAQSAVKAAGASEKVDTAGVRSVLDGIIKAGDTAPQKAVQDHAGVLAKIATGEMPPVPSRASVNLPNYGKLSDLQAKLAKGGTNKQAKAIGAALKVEKAKAFPSLMRPGKGSASGVYSSTIKNQPLRSAIKAQQSAIKKEVPEMTLTGPIKGANVTAERAKGGILSLVRTWQGNKTIRPDIDALKGAAERSVHERLIPMNTAMKALKEPEDMQLAWDVARGKVPRDLVDDTNVLAASDQLLKSQESLLGSSGIKGSNLKGQTVATRMGANKDEVNDMLHYYGAKTRLTDKPVKNAEGVVKDYSGMNMFNSWERVALTGKEVLPEMRKITLAMEMVARKNAFLDDLADGFGSRVPKPGYVQVRGHDRLKGVYFPKELASEIGVGMERMLEAYRPNSGFIKFFRDVTNVWKMAVTIVNPAHHVNNMVGDVFLSWMAGVNNPAVYKKAASILKRQSKEFRTGGMGKMEELVGAGSVANAITNAPGKVAGKTRSGLKYTDEQAYIAAHDQAIMRDMHMIEDIQDSPFSIRLSAKQPFKLGSAISTKEAQLTRMAHFIDALNKSKAKTLDEAFKEAGRAVRKWHPDGSDLTAFEQKAKLMVPFYSWLRKSSPLIIEGALLNPGKISGMNKMFYNMQTARGEEAELTNPFQTLGSMWPGWMSSPMTKNPVFAPRNPLNDFLTQLSRPKETAIGSLTPALKVPAELIMGERLDTGQKITNPKDYLLQQAPIASRARAFSKEETGPTSMLNWATGVNKSAPQDPAREALNKAFSAKEAKAEQTKALKKWAYERGLISPEQAAGGTIKKSLRAQLEAAFAQEQAGK